MQIFTCFINLATQTVCLRCKPVLQIQSKSHANGASNSDTYSRCLIVDIKNNTHASKGDVFQVDAM